MKSITFVTLPAVFLATFSLIPQTVEAQFLSRLFRSQQQGGSTPGQTYSANENQAAPQQAQPEQQPQQMNPTQQQAPQPMNSPAALPAGKPVIMEFSDLQCPDSARYNTGLKNTVMQRYINSGDAAYEFHDFPLPVHANAQQAAAAARCGGAATDQMRQQIMANQGQMSKNVYAQYARQDGVNSAEFSACLRQGQTTRDVLNDKALGESLGVKGTPTLVLGTADGNGNVRSVKVVKAYDPPQQVLAEIDSFMAQTADKH